MPARMCTRDVQIQSFPYGWLMPRGIRRPLMLFGLHVKNAYVYTSTETRFWTNPRRPIAPQAQPRAFQRENDEAEGDRLTDNNPDPYLVHNCKVSLFIKEILRAICG